MKEGRSAQALGFLTEQAIAKKIDLSSISTLETCKPTPWNGRRPMLHPLNMLSIIAKCLGLIKNAFNVLDINDEIILWFPGTF